MGKIFLLLLFLFLSVFSIGQITVGDSLIDELHNEKIDSSRIKINIELGHFYSSNNIDTALYFYNQALGIATQKKLDKFIARSLQALGGIYFYKSDYKKADSLFRRSHAMWQQLGNKLGICHTLANLGNIYLNQSNHLKANEHYLKSLRIAEELDNSFTVAGYLLTLE